MQSSSSSTALAHKWSTILDDIKKLRLLPDQRSSRYPRYIPTYPLKSFDYLQTKFVTMAISATIAPVNEKGSNVPVYGCTVMKTDSEAEPVNEKGSNVPVYGCTVM